MTAQDRHNPDAEFVRTMALDINLLREHGDPKILAETCYERIRARVLRQAAQQFFFNVRPNGTAVNCYRVAWILRAMAEGQPFSLDAQPSGTPWSRAASDPEAEDQSTGALVVCDCSE